MTRVQTIIHLHRLRDGIGNTIPAAQRLRLHPDTRIALCAETLDDELHKLWARTNAVLKATVAEAAEALERK